VNRADLGHRIGVALVAGVKRHEVPGLEFGALVMERLRVLSTMITGRSIEGKAALMHASTDDVVPRLADGTLVPSSSASCPSRRSTPPTTWWRPMRGSAASTWTSPERRPVAHVSR